MLNQAGSASILLGDSESSNLTVIGTGGGSRAVSTIESDLRLKFDPNANFTEGSYAKYENLESGKYKLTFRFSDVDNVNPDGIIFLQDNEVENKLTDAFNENTFTLSQQADAMGISMTADFRMVMELARGNLTVIVLDSNTTTNTSKVEIVELIKIGNLSQKVEAIAFNSADIIGDFTQTNDLIELATGGGSRAISSIGRHLDLNFDLENTLEAATEGTVAKFPGLRGKYRIYYELETYESQGSAKDIFYAWNSRELLPIANSSDATVQITSSRLSTGIQTADFDVFDTLGLFIADTEDTRNTSSVRILKIEQLEDFSLMEFPSHSMLMGTPLQIASKALVAYKSQLNYQLSNWQQDWQLGYNWYWHQLSPLNEENNLLAEEVRKMAFEDVFWRNDNFRKNLLRFWGIAAHTLNQIYRSGETSFSNDVSSLDSLGTIGTAIAIVRLHYELASEIGLLNNIDNSILDQIVPTYAARLDTLVNQASYFSPEHGTYVQAPIEWIIGILYDFNSGYLDISHPVSNPFEGFNEIYQNWRNSWGMD